MHTTRMLAVALTSVGITAAGLGLGTGTALAAPSVPHQWCPGDSMYPPAGPGAVYVWDMNVCHTWQYVRMGMGNVASRNLDGSIDNGASNVFDGPNPPPGSAFECGTGLFGEPIRC
ncbi:hypothetical protein [Mycobacterium asiaticum]|nr:hypothetical protein [Mycobacterium asiaticum]